MLNDIKITEEQLAELSKLISDEAMITHNDMIFVASSSVRKLINKYLKMVNKNSKLQ